MLMHARSCVRRTTSIRAARQERAPAKNLNVLSMSHGPETPRAARAQDQRLHDGLWLRSEGYVQRLAVSAAPARASRALAHRGSCHHAGSSCRHGALVRLAPDRGGDIAGAFHLAGSALVAEKDRAGGRPTVLRA